MKTFLIIRNSRFILLIFLFLISVNNIYPQKARPKAISANRLKPVNNLSPEKKLIQAFDNLIKVKSVRTEDKRITNGDTFDSLYEFLHPNKYHLKQYRVQQGKERNINYIIIGNTLFEKEEDNWFKQENPWFRDITIDVVKTFSKMNSFVVPKDSLVKNTSLEVKELEDEEIAADTVLLEYTFNSDFLPTKGKLWIKNNLPIRHIYETLPGCLNDIKGETVYYYESKITISNPLVEKPR